MHQAWGKGKHAAVKAVQIKPSVEECATGMGRILMHKMNLLHLDQNSTRLLQPALFPISVRLDLHPEDQKEVVFLKR